MRNYGLEPTTQIGALSKKRASTTQIGALSKKRMPTTRSGR